MSLDGKRIVVLGGSSGIGLATAQAAAREGGAVVIASSRRARVDEALATLPANAQGHALDLTDAVAMEALFAGIGAFDHLVFTAGETLMLGAIAVTDLAAAQRFFALRYWGAYAAAKFGSPHLQGGRVHHLHDRRRRAGARALDGRSAPACARRSKASPAPSRSSSRRCG